MSGFFSMDGPFYKVGNILADILMLSLAWIFFSIPIFTIGASTSALYYVTTRRIANRESYLMRDFWSSFKSNFITATLVWLLLLSLMALLIFNMLNIEVMGSMAGIMLPLQVCFLLELVLILIFVFPIIARFDMKLMAVLKSAFFMANRHILTSLACLLVGVLTLVISYFYFIFFIVAMGAYAYVTSYLIMRIFKKYRPEMDKNPLAESVED